MANVLDIENLYAGYDGNPVVYDLHLHVEAGEVVALVGPNGAGKTTTLLTIMGFLPPVSGQIRVDGTSIVQVAPHRLVSKGVELIPDDRSIIPSLTVKEHFSLLHRRLLDPFELFPELRPLAGRRAGLLSGGEQQMLAVARALATRPKLLLVDEISQGLAPIVVQRLLPRLRSAADTWSTGVVLVEQHVRQALSVADRAYVMVNGVVTMSGTGAEMLANRGDLEAAYLA
jgi:branched-chain amino acid transport system ATP-binding protein